MSAGGVAEVGVGAVDPWAVMSLREAQVARLVADGLSNRAITEQLGIPSVETTKSVVRRCFDKWGVRGRAELAARVAVAPGPVNGAGPEEGRGAARTLSRRGSGQQPGLRAVLCALTPREAQITRLVADGLAQMVDRLRDLELAGEAVPGMGPVSAPEIEEIAALARALRQNTIEQAQREQLARLVEQVGLALRVLLIHEPGAGAGWWPTAEVFAALTREGSR